MNKEKWIRKEIENWAAQSLIDGPTAEALKERYALKKNTHLLVLLFSVIGTLLVGTGIILIFAKNWDFLPLPVRVSAAFMPLLASQALAVFTVKRKYDSAAWREASAVLTTASVFTVVAMVGQIFHLPGDYGRYILICGLLSLPMMYILDSVVILLPYYWTILNWAALSGSPLCAPVLALLFSLGALFVFFKRKTQNSRFLYMLWVTVLAGFIAVWIMGALTESSLLLLILCYFILLLSVGGQLESFQTPFNLTGLLGSLVLLTIQTYSGMWDYAGRSIGAGGFIMMVVLLAGAAFFAIKGQDKTRLMLILPFGFIVILRCVWAIFSLDYPPYIMIFSVTANVVLLAVGVGFMIRGVMRTQLLIANLGLAVVCVWIAIRFFDSDMDFLWRGIGFLFLGLLFLLANLGILRMKKRSGAV